ncbi:MaoC family dehydratase [Sphingobium tyrosinilyticum]|uniref:MaoC/PaaZ C-terminal domain-containing protein n=1 Tax=Sphingobium tyrosinilyticum TaxID=2715436 RepID=A0ABV9F633_9SPHN
MTGTDERPIGARVTMDMLGSTGASEPIEWTERDVILYALGVGAGSTDADLRFTTENSAGIELYVLPSFLSAMTQPCKPPAFATLDQGRFLHAEQRVELSQDIPVSGRGFMQPQIDLVIDKGKGAILRNVVTVRADSVDGPIIGRTYSSVFVTGGGGFGGPRGSQPTQETPERAPEARITNPLRPDQALLYRLSGDRNPLHSDPSFSKPRGFNGPILHGLCTYGFACRALIEAAGPNAGSLRMMSGRFRKPVFPGDALTTEIWFQTPGDALFRVLDGSGEIVFEGGSATFA